MTRADVPAIMSIENIIYAYPWTAGIFADCIQVGYDCWVLASNEIEAYGVMSIGAAEAHLLNISVAKYLQNSGRGTELVNHFLKIAAAKKADTAFLEVRPSNLAAIHLYQKLGFTEVGVRKAYYPSRGRREDAIIFAKNIFSDIDMTCSSRN